jgi:LL-diaminopimelate aminotransferase
MAIFEKAKRLEKIPPYLFAQIDRIKEKKIREGVDVISLGIGDPDLPTPPHIIEALYKAAKDPKNHQYPSYEGMLEFRIAVSEWYRKKFSVELDPENEILTLIGSKEGIVHIFLAFVNEGDYTLIPDPGYPPYKIGTILAGGIPYSMPLKEENKFLPSLEEIPEDIAKKAKIMFLNYPNMPTSAVAEIDFFEKVVEFAKKYNIIVCHDFPYSEITFDGYKAKSFLQAKGAKEVSVEFHSLSKTYNMTGWRIGWCCGNREIVEALKILKTNIDSGVFQAIQIAGISALKGEEVYLEKTKEIYKIRRDKIISTLKSLGWEIEPPLATLYIWAKVPSGFTSTSFAEYLLEKCGVIVVPGVGYGEYGEGYFRISLTVNDEKLDEALKRIRESGIRYK